MTIRLPSWRGLAIWAAAAAGLVGLGAVLVAWSGLINVAASRGHWALVSWFLELAMRSSIRTHSLGVGQSPPLGDSELVRLGAGHFAGGCAPCHGAPGEPRSPITLRMLPPPTDLTKAIPTWQPHQLFWIVKHGVKYTGMPAWAAEQRNDEVWAIVAFLLELPGLSAAGYEALALGNVRFRAPPPRELVRSGTRSTALAACARCHGDEESTPTSQLVPALAGQREAYLERSLREYASGERPSGVMEPIAAALEERERSQLASYYAALPAQARTGDSPGAGLVAEGRRIAIEGVPQQSIPACYACHRDTAAGLFPRLEGQAARYLSSQLRLWRNGGRDRTVPGRIMATVAARLTERQIAAVAAFFESAAPGSTASSRPSGAREPLP
jgi:cytochrome c553